MTQISYFALWDMTKVQNGLENGSKKLIAQRTLPYHNIASCSQPSVMAPIIACTQCIFGVSIP